MNLKQIKPGKQAPKDINVIIEIPEGSGVKYEFDKEANMIVVDRFAFTTMGYPLNYGFVPNTHADDGDPLDVLVLASKTVYPGVMIACRPVGMLEMEDEEGVDTKIIAVPLDKVDPFYAHVKDVTDISEAIKNKIKHFFEHYKDLEPGKWVKVRNWKDKSHAEKAIKASLS